MALLASKRFSIELCCLGFGREPPDYDLEVTFGLRFLWDGVGMLNPAVVKGGGVWVRSSEDTDPLGLFDVLEDALGPECIRGEHSMQDFDLALEVGLAGWLPTPSHGPHDVFEVTIRLNAWVFRDGSSGDDGDLSLRMHVSRDALNTFAQELRAEYDSLVARAGARPAPSFRHPKP